MKRYIKASTWNGIVPVKAIVENSNLDRNQAKLLKEWIYQTELDTGYRYLEEFVEATDFDQVYEDMLKYKERYPDRWQEKMGMNA